MLGDGGEGVKVIWLTNRDGVSLHDQWDAGLFKLMFEGILWEHFIEFEHLDVDGTKGERTPVVDSAIFMLPARHHTMPGDIAWINEQIGQTEHCILMLVGDEEGTFPWREIIHRDLTFWVMMPHPVKHADLATSPQTVFVGNGFKEDTIDILDALGYSQKPHLWSFAGQITHPRRKQAANGLKKVMARAPGLLHESRGFTQGLDRREYLELLHDSRVAPCPSGPHTPDTFRFYEALEAGCFPIPDATTPDEANLGYWRMVYGEDFPFPTIFDWESVGGIVEAECVRWPVNANVAGAWWEQQKRRLTKTLLDWCYKHGEENLESPLTTIITSSPTLGSPQEQFDRLMDLIDSQGLFCFHEIMICFDGVRPEQEHLKDNYNEYVRMVVNHCRQWANCWTPIVAKHHVHQIGLMRMAMDLVDTPAVLFMEHDTPLLDHREIPRTLVDLVADDHLDVVRLHHEDVIQPDHEHLMVDHETTTMLGIPVRRTHQWSARPHIARSDYYRRVLAQDFTAGANCFLEDRLHSAAQVNPSEHRIAIYHPEGGIKRSTHTDARAGEPKFDREQIF